MTVANYGCASLSRNKVAGIQLLVLFGAAKFPAANERCVYSLGNLRLFSVANGLLLWRRYLVDQLASDFSHGERSSSEHPDLRVGLLSGAVDRMVHHGRVDRAGVISFCSMDLRNFASRPELAVGWRRNFLPRGHSFDCVARRSYSYR